MVNINYKNIKLLLIINHYNDLIIVIMMIIAKKPFDISIILYKNIFFVPLDTNRIYFCIVFEQVYFFFVSIHIQIQLLLYIFHFLSIYYFIFVAKFGGFGFGLGFSYGYSIRPEAAPAKAIDNSFCLITVVFFRLH